MMFEGKPWSVSGIICQLKDNYRYNPYIWCSTGQCTWSFLIHHMHTHKMHYLLLFLTQITSFHLHVKQKELVKPRHIARKVWKQCVGNSVNTGSDFTSSTLWNAFSVYTAHTCTILLLCDSLSSGTKLRRVNISSTQCFTSTVFIHVSRDLLPARKLIAFTFSHSCLFSATLVPC